MGFCGVSWFSKGAAHVPTQAEHQGTKTCKPKSRAEPFTEVPALN